MKEEYIISTSLLSSNVNCLDNTNSAASYLKWHQQASGMVDNDRNMTPPTRDDGKIPHEIEKA
jgi:hypothetical protein